MNQKTCVPAPNAMQYLAPPPTQPSRRSTPLHRTTSAPPSASPSSPLANQRHTSSTTSAGLTNTPVSRRQSMTTSMATTAAVAMTTAVSAARIADCQSRFQAQLDYAEMRRCLPDYFSNNVANLHHPSHQQHPQQTQQQTHQQAHQQTHQQTHQQHPQQTHQQTYQQDHQQSHQQTHYEPHIAHHTTYHPSTTAAARRHRNLFANGLAMYYNDINGYHGTSTVAIDDKIEQAMDLVKSHLVFAVREEVEILKEQIVLKDLQYKELLEKYTQLELENSLIRHSASPIENHIVTTTTTTQSPSK